MDKPLLEGTITGDTEIIVRYSRQKYRVTIYYQFMDGTEAAETWTDTLYSGEGYDVECPKIEGYRTARQRVIGIVHGADVVITVLYVPDSEGERLVGIDDYETPLGIRQLTVQVGLCIE